MTQETHSALAEIEALRLESCQVLDDWNVLQGKFRRLEDKLKATEERDALQRGDI